MITTRSAAVAAMLAGLALGTAAPVLAADLLPPPPPPPAPVPVEIGSGWYLRADFTQSDFNHPKDSTLIDEAAPVPPLLRLRLSPEPGYGGGIGYRFTPWLRVDATIDQRMPSRFTTYSSGSNFTRGYNIEAGKLDVLTGLVNVYADLGTWWGLTPYIGGGIGFAQKDFRNAYTQTTCTVPITCDGSPVVGPRTAVPRPNGSVTSLAWALTGGVAYEIGGGLSLDASYRYVNLGRAKTGLDEYGYGTRLKDIASNEVRVGLRYSFGGLGTGGYGGNPYEQ